MEDYHQSYTKSKRTKRLRMIKIYRFVEWIVPSWVMVGQYSTPLQRKTKHEIPSRINIVTSFSTHLKFNTRWRCTNMWKFSAFKIDFVIFGWRLICHISRYWKSSFLYTIRNTEIQFELLLEPVFINWLSGVKLNYWFWYFLEIKDFFSQSAVPLTKRVTF